MEKKSFPTEKHRQRLWRRKFTEEATLSTREREFDLTTEIQNYENKPIKFWVLFFNPSGCQVKRISTNQWWLTRREMSIIFHRWKCTLLLFLAKCFKRLKCVYLWSNNVISRKLSYEFSKFTKVSTCNRIFSVTLLINKGEKLEKLKCSLMRGQIQ